MSKVRKPCVCRGFLEADPADPVDVEKAVQSHQQELQHLAWRAMAQINGELVAPERVAVGAPLPALHGRRMELEPVELHALVRRIA